MGIYIGLFISFILLFVSVLKNIFIGYALMTCWSLFVFIAVKKGLSFKDILKMSYVGGKNSFVVLKNFMLIGGIIGVWMVSGTIPTIVYYSLKYISPSTFVFLAFIICSITSCIIGTSLGTVSVVGIPLMIIARGGDINLNIVAGAIIAGAYFGDRCSPLSSSAALVADLTQTNIFINIKNMILSSLIPFFLSLIFYYILSVFQPLKVLNTELLNELKGTFHIDIWMLLPALVILVLSICKVKINYSISISIITAMVLAVVFQKAQIRDVIHSLIFGFRINESNPLQNVIKGGGIVSMLGPCLIIFVSCSLAGIFAGIKALDRLKTTMEDRKMSEGQRFGTTLIVSILAAGFGCNQSISTVMTSEIMKDCYHHAERRFALDLENSGILISALIPWNIAALVPTVTLHVSLTGFIPFAFYLYVLPFVYFIYCKFVKGRHSFLGKRGQSS